MEDLSVKIQIGKWITWNRKACIYIYISIYTYTNISGELDENSGAGFGALKMDHIRSIGRSMFLSFRFFWNIAWNIYIYTYIYISICSKCWDHFPWGCRNGPANCCIYGFSPGYVLSELGWFVGFTGLFFIFYHSILYVRPQVENVGEKLWVLGPLASDVGNRGI